MIPILYESTETAFISNGLGRLRDCISCVVTEERNGIFECDFEYPISAEDFDLIQLGRIIGVTHDETDDVQPFDIVSASKPIDGVVTFHAVHISYRLSFQTVTGTSINSLAAAFNLFGSVTGTPFSYWTDKTSTGYLASADGIPKSVRQMLGGIEGSVLDAYGGEYEWDRFTVRLYESRGQYRDFAIRYGVNMLDYTEETDASETWSSCVPYWTDGTEIVVGSKQNSGGSTITGRDQCIPLDVSEKFENKPTKAQVEAAARSYMNANVPYLPTQTINVSFVRLQDMSEYAGFSNLLTCNLCDTIKVIFPDYKTSATFKIVKTVWDVLSDRYDSMELGTLSTTLAEALGITQSNETQITLPTMPSYSYENLTWATGTSGSTLKLERWGNVRTLTIANPTKLATGNNVVYNLASSDRPSVSIMQVLIQPVGAIANGGIFLSIRASVQTNGNIELYNYRSSAINGNTNQSGTLTWIVSD